MIENKYLVVQWWKRRDNPNPVESIISNFRANKYMPFVPGYDRNLDYTATIAIYDANHRSASVNEALLNQVERQLTGLCLLPTVDELTDFYRALAELHNECGVKVHLNEVPKLAVWVDVCNPIFRTHGMSDPIFDLTTDIHRGVVSHKIPGYMKITRDFEYTPPTEEVQAMMGAFAQGKTTPRAQITPVGHGDSLYVCVSDILPKLSNPNMLPAVLAYTAKKKLGLFTSPAELDWATAREAEFQELGLMEASGLYTFRVSETTFRSDLL